MNLDCPFLQISWLCCNSFVFHNGSEWKQWLTLLRECGPTSVVWPVLLVHWFPLMHGQLICLTFWANFSCWVQKQTRRWRVYDGMYYEVWTSNGWKTSRFDHNSPLCLCLGTDHKNNVISFVKKERTKWLDSFFSLSGWAFVLKTNCSLFLVGEKIFYKKLT